MNIFFTPISCSSVMREIRNIRMYYLFFLSQVVDYFSSHGSTLHVTLLNTSKAFGRVNHI